MMWETRRCISHRSGDTVSISKKLNIVVVTNYNQATGGRGLEAINRLLMNVVSNNLVMFREQLYLFPHLTKIVSAPLYVWHFIFKWYHISSDLVDIDSSRRVLESYDWIFCWCRYSLTLVSVISINCDLLDGVWRRSSSDQQTQSNSFECEPQQPSVTSPTLHWTQHYADRHQSWGTPSCMLRVFRSLILS